MFISKKISIRLFLYSLFILISFTDLFSGDDEGLDTPSSTTRKIQPSDLTHFPDSLIPDRFRIVPGLPISGSHQYTTAQLAEILTKIPRQPEFIFFIDLREELHLMSEQNTTVSIQAAKANAYKGIKVTDIQDDEEAFSRKFLNFCTEEACVRSMGAQYLRIAITDASRPEDSDIDEFISFLRKIKNKGIDYWLHFHCLLGLGRTTTLMAIYKMIESADDDLSLDDILREQHEIGGANLAFMWYSPHSKKWITFLEEFYAYSRAGFKQGMSWSQWVSQQQLEPFQESSSIDLWWSVRGINAYCRFAAMMSYLRLFQFIRWVRWFFE